MILDISINQIFKKPSYLNLIKIAIIIFSSFFLIMDFHPFYQGADDLVYGITAMDLSKGQYGFTNELMQKYDGGPFVPSQWVKTIHNTAIPITIPGIIFLGTTSYLIGGIYGLFYLGPIVTTLLFIFSERIATKLFGGIAGLVTLVLVISHSVIFEIGKSLLTDNIFTLFLILGCYYLIKFFHEKKEKHILFCSVFFTLSTFFRLNGVVSFPLEVILVAGYFVINFIYSKRDNVAQKNKSTLDTSNNLIIISSFKLQYLLKIGIFLIIPWLVFFAFFAAFNDYYFGDPFTNYSEQRNPELSSETNRIGEIFNFDSNRIEWIKYLSIGFMPDEVRIHLLDFMSPNDSHFSGSNWIAIIVFLILISSLLLSWRLKNKKTEVIVIILLIIGTVVFYSSIFNSTPYSDVQDISNDLQKRYMIPNFVLTSMLLGFIINRIWLINFKNKFNNRFNFQKSYKIIVSVILALFLFSSLYDSSLGESIRNEKISFRNPIPYSDYILAIQTIPEKNVLIDSGRAAMFFSMMPFNSVSSFENGDTEPIIINDEHISILKEIMDEGYSVFAFQEQTKESWQFLNYLEVKHGLILKQYSTNFCILEKINNFTKAEESKNDKLCEFSKII